jgi:hypothetical protein
VIPEWLDALRAEVFPDMTQAQIDALLDAQKEG